MTNNFYVIPKDEDLQHHGILGMKWGVRRYQNKNGTLTPAEKKRYGNKSAYEVTTSEGDTFRVTGGSSKRRYNGKNSKVTKTYGQHLYEKDTQKLQKKARRLDRTKRRLTPEQRAKIKKKVLYTLAVAEGLGMTNKMYNTYTRHKYKKAKG